MSSGNDIELREKVARICAEISGRGQEEWQLHLPNADRILALPEIAEALQGRAP